MLNGGDCEGFPKGSDWRKWDLHVHTPQSSLQNLYGGDWEAYLSTIEAFGNEVAVIGVTDYCTISGYEKLLAYREKGRISNIEAIFPNIEFRITPETQKDKGVNIHLIINLQPPTTFPGSDMRWPGLRSVTETRIIPALTSSWPSWALLSRARPLRRGIYGRASISLNPLLSVSNRGCAVKLGCVKTLS